MFLSMASSFLLSEQKLYQSRIMYVNNMAFTIGHCEAIWNIGNRLFVGSHWRDSTEQVEEWGSPLAPISGGSESRELRKTLQTDLRRSHCCHTLHRWTKGRRLDDSKAFQVGLSIYLSELCLFAAICWLLGAVRRLCKLQVWSGGDCFPERIHGANWEGEDWRKSDWCLLRLF